MSDGITVVTLSAAQLAETVRLAVIDALRQTDRRPLDASTWLSIPETMKRYRIGRIELRRMIDAGEVPATRRRAPGGSEALYILHQHAERALGAKVKP